MARVEIPQLEDYVFEVELPIMLAHINRGDHLGNEHLIAFLNDARVQYMAACGVPEYTDAGPAMINADLAVVYKSEARYGERLRIAMSATDFNKYGCDVLYRVTAAADGRVVALAKTAHLHYDTRHKKLLPCPEGFREKLLRQAARH